MGALEAVPILSHRRVVATLLLALFVAAPSLALGLSAPVPHEEPERVRSIGERIGAHLHGAEHPLRPLEPSGDPLSAALARLNHDDAQGRTPVEWVRSARADRWLALDGAARAADLAGEVERLQSLAGVSMDEAQRARLATDAAALPDDLRGALASLVAATADAYAAQLPVAADVLARFPPADPENALFVPHAQRDAMAANAETVLRAMNAFEHAARRMEPPQATAAAPLFSDPFDLVVVGSTAADTFARTGALRDPILLVDLGGDDTYLTTAGGACPDLLSLVHECNGLALSAVLDLGGNDRYLWDAGPAGVQGAGTLGAVGLLVDLAGDDTYSSKMTRGTDSAFPFPTGYVDGGAQGFSEAGFGLLLDASGNDRYQADVESTHGRSIWNFAQGFGGLGGLGVLADAEGHDAYVSHGLGIPASRGFQGVYTDGASIYSGVGILVDTGMGNDAYHAWNNGTTTDYYAQGFGAFGGVGILFEDGGDDDYVAFEIAYDPFIEPLLNCAYGTASFGGVGVFLEMGGDDRYFGDTQSPRAAATMNEGYGGPGEAYGLFVDVSGDDGHFMEANGGPGSYTAGRGVLLTGGNIAGTYLDLGGADAYTGAAPSGDNTAWAAGADINAPIDVFG